MRAAKTDGGSAGPGGHDPDTVKTYLISIKRARLEAAAANSPAIGRLKVNSHLHLPPNFSAFQTVRQAVELAAEQQIGVLGVSNYYDYDVYGAQQHAPLLGIDIP